jgi:MFS family permease
VKTPRELAGIASEKLKPENPFKRKYLKSLDVYFWRTILLALIFEMGHFSEHMFPLYANIFLPVSISGTVSSFVSMGQVLLSFLVGILADMYGKRRLIVVCIILMIIANICFISAQFVENHQIICIYAGAFLWGGEMTAIQGLFLSLISERVDFHLRATAMGVYFFVLGIAYFCASFMAGKIWDNLGNQYIFMYSMFFSFLALCLIRMLIVKKYKSS